MSFVLDQLNPWPGFISERLELYERLKKESDANLAKQAANSKPISVQLPDGQRVEARSWVTTPYQLVCGVRWATGMNRPTYNCAWTPFTVRLRTGLELSDCGCNVGGHV